MIMLDCLKERDYMGEYLIPRADYDDLFLMVIDFFDRLLSGGMVFDSDHLDGIAGLECNIEDEYCREMFIVFVFLFSNAVDPAYILAAVRECLYNSYCSNRDCKSALPFSKSHVLYILLETSLGGLSAIATIEKIAGLSLRFCSPEASAQCFEFYNKMLMKG